MIRATFLVRISPDKMASVLNTVKKLEGVREAYPVMGRWDLVLQVEVPRIEFLEDLGERLTGIPGVTSINTIVELPVKLPEIRSQKIEVEKSYQFIMKWRPNILRGVDINKWNSFLRMLHEERVRLEQVASERVQNEIARELNIILNQVKEMNCARKCLALYNYNSPAFNACYEKCQRTGDP